MSTDARPMAPVIIFAYARADHLQRTVESLLANPEAGATDVLFYCDAAKTPGHQPKVDAVRAYVELVRGFRSIKRISRASNMGLMRSVIDGVTQTLAAHGRAIVLEDDLLLSPHFLRYMNDGLARYEHDPRVASIHGYVYPCETPLPETFFLKGADCWGWATWSRGWAHFDADGAKLLRELRARKLTHEFDFDGQFPYTGMLQDQIAGRNSSWAILWYASCFLQGLLTLYPGRSLVENIGNDSSGTHCGTTDTFGRAPALTPVQPDAIEVEPSRIGRDAFVRFFSAQRSWKTRLRSSVKRLLVSEP
ncbi:MAG: glycosyltransferase family 2 protein [Caldimonas sp.]